MAKTDPVDVLESDLKHYKRGRERNERRAMWLAAAKAPQTRFRDTRRLKLAAAEKYLAGATLADLSEQFGFSRKSNSVYYHLFELAWPFYEQKYELRVPPGAAYGLGARGIEAREHVSSLPLISMLKAAQAAGWPE